MKNIIFVSILLSLSTAAYGSDSWDSCASADGVFILENGEISMPLQNEEENYVLGDLVKKILIKTKKETCKLVNDKSTVLSLTEETSYEVYQMNIGEYFFQQEFLCVRGGSGIPANDYCDENTAKLVEKYEVK